MMENNINLSKCHITEQKQYIIPTKNWLKPVEPLIIEDSNTAGLLMIAKLVNEEKVIVKITKNKNKKIIVLSNNLSILFNFVKTYCSFSCTEKYEKIDKKYQDNNYFCSTTATQYITVEIMKKYSGSLSTKKNKLSRNNVCRLLSQLLYSIMESFNKYGFVHGDLSLGNILYCIQKKNQIIDYELTNFRTTRLNVEIGDIIPIISDFDKSESYKKEIYYQYNSKPIKLLLKGYKQTNTIFESLSKIIQDCVGLIENQEEQYFIKNEINIIFSSDKYEEYYRHSYKSLRDYLLDEQTKSYEEMIKETYLIYMEFVNTIMKIFTFDKKFMFIPIPIDNF